LPEEEEEEEEEEEDVCVLRYIGKIQLRQVLSLEEYCERRKWAIRS